MSTTSADPSKLQEFVTGVRTARTGAETEQSSVASLSASTIAACEGYVRVQALHALSTLLDSMGENETFVTTIRTELLAADDHDGGAITISDASVAAALSAAGVGTPPPVVQFNPLSVVGIPQTSGFVDDPICAANGNMVHQDTDLEFPAIAAALDMVRTYNSVVHDRAGSFGEGWSSVLDVALVRDGDSVQVTLPDGGQATFHRSLDGERPTWRSESRRLAGLDEVADGGGYIAHFDRERRLRFDAGGVLVGWETGVARVVADRDAEGRIASLQELTTGRGLDVVWEDGHVARLVSSDGRAVTYRRDERARLVTVSTFAGELRYDWDGTLLVSVTDSDDVVLFVNIYDDDGRVVQQTSPFGRVTHYTYQVPGATVIADDRGVRQAMVHDRRGNLTAVVDTDGSAMRLTYDDADRVVEVVSKSGATWRYVFDPGTGDLLVRHDPDGRSQSWTWDDHGRPLTETDRTGAVTTFEYSGDFRTPVRVVGPDGMDATAVLDTAGNPVSVTDADGVIRHLEWDRDGQVTGVTDANGATTTFQFDAAGSLVRLADPSGVETRLQYEHGRVARSERGDSVSTYVRTPGGRIYGGVEPGDVPWSATFGPHGAMESITDALGSTARYEYDSLGNVIAVVAPDGAAYRNEFDEIGRLVAASDPTGATLRKRYDVEGRVIEFVDLDGHRMHRTLDVLGRTVESVGPDGAATSWTYHPNGEVATVAAPDGRVWTTEIDEYGRVTAVTDPAGGRATREYSAAGRLVARTSPAGRIERFDYDPAGRCVAVVGVDGVRRELHLDERGQVIAVDSTHGDGADAEPRVEMVWDDHRRLTGLRTDAGETRFDRDPSGRLLAAVDPTGVTTRFEWDERGLLQSAMDAAGAVSAYRYDERGRLVGQTMPGDRTTTWSYDLGGRVGSTTDPMGVTTDVVRSASGVVAGVRRGDGGWDRTFDDAGREIERRSRDGTVLGSYAYDVAGRMVSASSPATGLFTEFLWDEANRITEITDSTGTSTIERDADGWTVAFTSQAGVRTVVERDPSGRVVGLRDDEAGDFRLPDDQVVRDPAGRLLIGPDGSVYRYDDAGRLCELAPSDQEPTTYEYGDDGLVAVESGPGGTRRFEYDAAGRVRSITVDGVGTTEVDYDAAGRRSVEIEPDGTVTEFGWNAIDQLIEIVRTSPAGESSRVSIELDALGRPQRVGGLPVGHDPATGCPNLVGDIRILNAGALSWRSDDEQWGRTRRDQPVGLHVAGLTLVGARVYDPRSRQFLSSDPLMTVPGSNGGASAYTYAWQDPVNFVDPTGLRPVSKEVYDAIRTREEQGSLGRAWEAIKEDPWGTVAMVGVVALGVGLMFVPGGQVIGAGILVGAAMSAGVGLATGTFDPRQVALGGLIGGVSGGAGAMTSSLTGAVVTGAVVSGGHDLASQAISGQPIDWRSVGVNTVVGAATGGVGRHLSPTITTRTQAFFTGAVTGGAGDVTTQALTGDGTVNWGQAGISALGGGTGGALDHHFDQSRPSLLEPTRPVGPQLGGDGPDTMTVYRGTSNGLELDIRNESGLVMSDAGRSAYMRSGGDVDVAQGYSDAAHRGGVEAWGSEGDYVEAHGAFGHEVRDVSGDRSMVSVTTDPDVAQRFAGKDGVVLRGEVPRDSLLPQTLSGSNESEYLARHSIPMEPMGPNR